MENIAIKQLQEHVNNEKLMPTYQSAYREFFSCETALLKLCDEILWAMENKEIQIVICTDLSAAFDTVDHEILLNVMSKTFGVKETCLGWFKSYLNNRQFKVAIDNVYSETKQLQFSVPQGSRGGPDLYVLYSSTVQNVITDNTGINAYADDHNFSNKFKPGSDNSNELACIADLEKFIKLSEHLDV